MDGSPPEGKAWGLREIARASVCHAVTRCLEPKIQDNNHLNIMPTLKIIVIVTIDSNYHANFI